MSDLQNNVEHLGVELDERGLFPLATAREIVGNAKALTRDLHKVVTYQIYGTSQDTQVLQGDLVWGALLSLEDAEEFLKHVSGLRWDYLLRGHHNIAAVERYGDPVVTWIARNVNDQGTLRHVPWCLVPCLLAIKTEQAYKLARRVRKVVPGKTPDTRHSNTPEEPVAELWIKRNPAQGFAFLAKDVAAGDDEAKLLLKKLAKIDPPGVHALVASEMGAEGADKLFRSLRLSLKPRSRKLKACLEAAESASVPSGPLLTLLTLDTHFVASSMPMWDSANTLTLAMQASGFASPTGDVLVFQELATGGASEARVELWAYGPSLGDGGHRWTEVDVVGEHPVPDRIGEYPLDDAGKPVWRGEVRGEAVEVSLDVERWVKRGLDPIAAVLYQLSQPPFRQQVFLSPAELVAELGLGPDAEHLFTLDAWDHPDAGGLASDSLDLRTMTEALRFRKRITSVPKGTTNLKSLKGRLRELDCWVTDPKVWKG